MDNKNIHNYYTHKYDSQIPLLLSLESIGETIWSVSKELLEHLCEILLIPGSMDFFSVLERQNGPHHDIREYNFTVNVLSKKKGKDQESIQSSNQPDPGYQRKSDNVTIEITNESQVVSPFPAGDHMASTNRCA